MAEELKRQFENLGENTEKYITFLVPIEKEPTNGKTVTYKMKFTNIIGCMANSLWNLVNNSAKCLHGGKCKDCKSYLSM